MTLELVFDPDWMRRLIGVSPDSSHKAVSSATM